MNRLETQEALDRIEKGDCPYAKRIALGEAVPTTPTSYICEFCELAIAVKESRDRDGTAEGDKN